MTTDKIPTVFELNRTDIFPKPGSPYIWYENVSICSYPKVVNVLSTDP